MSDWKGKKYLITGASSGIGKQLAIRLDALGANVILLSRDATKLKSVCSTLSNNSSFIPFDLSQLDDIKKIYDELKEKKVKLDGLIHCAGLYVREPIRITEPQALEKILRVNTLSFFCLCKYFSKVDNSRKGSSIVAISSYSAITKESGMCAYAMSKTALNTQIEVMSKEFAKRQIRVNAVMPASVENKMGQDGTWWTDEEIANMQRNQPFGIIPIEQVLNCVEFLLSDNAAYITGECISISGGYKSKG